MSVIAWDGKVLAADKRCIVGNCTFITTKIFKVDNLLVGYTGESVVGEEMLAWIVRGGKHEEFPAVQKTDDWTPFLIIRPNREILVYEKGLYPVRLAAQRYAMGSGRDAAMMAMHLGLSAPEAVLKTNEIVPSCGDGVDILS